jgi:hypothetical protein
MLFCFSALSPFIRRSFLFADNFLNKTIPGITRWTFAEPFGRFVAAGLTEKKGFCFGHTLKGRQYKD